MSFLGEIKRRKGFQVAAVYAVVAWLLVQIVATIETPLGLPDWFDTAVIVLLIIGFPITLIISWAFNLTPEGLVRDSGEALTRGRTIEYLLIGLVILAMGWLTHRVEFSASNLGARDTLPNSVAVLPCDNLSPDPDNGYFAASLHQEILTRLGKLRNLNVIGRTSVLQYTNTSSSVPEIADKLSVESVMECSVSFADGRVAISARLIDGETGVNVWNDSWNRELLRVFEIQADIAISVANALQAEFSESERVTVQNSSTNSPDAYVFYMRSLTASNRNEALGLLEKAVDIDPEFAAAHGEIANALANSLIDTASGAASNRDERFEIEQRLRWHADRAISLEENQSEAWGARGIVELYFWRWAAAEANFDRAFQTGVGRTIPWAYAWWGRTAETIQRARRNVALSPADSVQLWQLGIAYAYDGDYDSAAAGLEESIAINPNFAAAHYWLGGVEFKRGNLEKARDEVRRGEALLGDLKVPILLAEVAYLYMLVGEFEDATRIVSVIESLASDTELGAGTWAMTYLASREPQRALGWLDIAAEKAERHQLDTGFILLMNIRMNPFKDPVLDGAEFAAVRRRLSGF